jgi:hypothetical protein
MLQADPRSAACRKQLNMCTCRTDAALGIYQQCAGWQQLQQQLQHWQQTSLCRQCIAWDALLQQSPQ